jgi:two-component system response regulator DesR
MNSYLLRGALAAVLGKQTDLTVVAELDRADGVVSRAACLHPQVVILDIDEPGDAGVATSRRFVERMPDCALLALTERLTARVLAPALDAGVHGFASANASPERLVETVRRVTRGELVIDPEDALIALRGASNPLTERERQVLRIAAEGVPSPEIAARLFLAPGTVRNHLSAAMQKLDANNRLAAVRRATEDGWL